MKNSIRSLLHRTKTLARVSKRVVSLSLFTAKYELQKNLGLRQIKVINFNAIDVCNSHCQMCDIWKQKEDKKLSPEQFGKIFEDKLFRDVEHVGVTGGEPTLRDDLLEIYKTIIKKLKKIKGVSIITNAIRSKDVTDKILAINDLCKRSGISFNAMISLDGVGSVHDRIRGTAGNFSNTMAVIDQLKAADIPVSIGCTISTNNVWNVDELLYNLRKKNIYGRFRVAEFIKRLYNSNSKVIRNFNEDESYQLAIFFHKLEYSYEPDPVIRRTYQNVRNMLLGGKRKIGCPFHSEGIVLGAEGQLRYCAPKSEDIGDALTESAASLYRNSLSEKERIHKADCENCIHDYHYPELLGEYFERIWEKLQLKFFNSQHIEKTKTLLNLMKLAAFPSHGSIARRVLIVGWYGTETVGDKAILNGIIELYKEKYGEVEFVLGSIVPYITERTVTELGIKASVINSRTFSLFKEIQSVDEVIMGGGPLMDLEDLMIPHNAFYYAKLLSKKTTVYGCGIGPLYINQYEDLVKRILVLSDDILLRDEASVKKATEYLDEYGMKKNIVLSGDPARKYLTTLRKSLLVEEKRDELCLFLRDWTYEYGRKYSYEEYERIKKSFEVELREIILTKARNLGIKKIRFCHMHNFAIGNDDRDFSLRFIDEYLSDVSEFEIVYDKKLSTVKNICEAMLTSRYNLCMRFHSVVFAHTLGTDFGALDYTLGGKVYNFLKDNDRLDNLIPVAALTV